MERTTTQIITPNKQKVVINDWISGLEDEQIQKTLIGDTNIQADAKEPQATIAGNNLIDYERECLKACVVSVNGSGDNYVETLLALPKVDVDFVKSKVSEIVSATSQKKS